MHGVPHCMEGMTMQQPIRVGIVHDHRLFSDVVTALLHQEKEIILAEGSDGNGTLPTERTLPCDVMLIDASMARMNAVHVTRAIKRASPTVQVIALGVESGDEEVLRFIEAGASGYILKNASYAELLYTIKAVHHGLTPCSPRVAALVFARIAALTRQQQQFQPGQKVSLTRREHEVLQLMAGGYRNGEIAHQLEVALDTVKRHVANIFKKFQVHGRRAVVQRADEYGLLKEVRRLQSAGVAGRV